MFLIERGTDGEKTNPTVFFYKKKFFFDEIEFVQDLTHKLKSKLSFTALSWIGSNIRR